MFFVPWKMCRNQTLRGLSRVKWVLDCSQCGTAYLLSPGGKLQERHSVRAISIHSANTCDSCRMHVPSCCLQMKDTTPATHPLPGQRTCFLSSTCWTQCSLNLYSYVQLPNLGHKRKVQRGEVRKKIYPVQLSNYRTQIIKQFHGFCGQKTEHARKRS